MHSVSGRGDLVMNWHVDKQRITHGQNTMMLVLNSNTLDQRSKFCNLQTGRLFVCTVSVSGRGDLVMNYN